MHFETRIASFIFLEFYGMCAPSAMVRTFGSGEKSLMKVTLLEYPG